MFPQDDNLQCLLYYVWFRDKGVGPASGRLGVRIPAATDLKTGSDSSTANSSTISVCVMGPQR